MYDYYSNIINETVIKFNNKGSIIKGYKNMHDDLWNAEISPIMLWLGNETSTEMIEAIEEKDL